MEFRILGPIEVVDDAGRAVPLGGARQRALLAALLLHANELVLLDQLMEDLWGERPPATGAKALQVAVSQLRKTLGDGVLQTRPAGYVLQVEPEQLDSTRFEALRQQARGALGSGRPAEAASTLREALGLWRGPALGDIAYEAFVRAEADRLEELRLVALEERVQADLALGRHTELVAELEALVARHPLRERLREQLMLALYRSGRQSEALEVYRETRRMLAEELGIEPDERLHELERAILRHDPALAGVAETPILTTVRPRSRSRRFRLAAAAAAAAAVVAATLVLAFTGPNTLASASPNSVAVIDPARNALVAELAVGESPRELAVGGGALWVLNINSLTINRIDPRARRVTQTFGVGGSPYGLAASADAIFVVDGERGNLVRINPENPRADQTVALSPDVMRAARVAFDGTDAWIVSRADVDLIAVRVSSLESSVRRVPLGRPGRAVAPSGEFVWVALDDGTVALVDTLRRGVVATARVGAQPADVAVGAGAVWVASGDGTVTRLKAAPVQREATIRVGRDPSGIVVGAGAVWVVNRLDGTVSRIDPRTNRVVATIRVGERPERVVVVGGLVWVSVRSK